jgi:hypothetical protein
VSDPFYIVPDNPARVAGPGELASDWGYRESTSALDADALNDELWLKEHDDGQLE